MEAYPLSSPTSRHHDTRSQSHWREGSDAAVARSLELLRQVFELLADPISPTFTGSRATLQRTSGE
jgi:hypothetical protein